MNPLLDQTPARADAGPAGWGETIDELLRLRSLSDDWDGEGSPAPTPALVDGAITLARTLEGASHQPPGRVTASVNGTVYFEWRSPMGYHEIEVTSPEAAEFRWVPKGR